MGIVHIAADIFRNTFKQRVIWLVCIGTLVTLYLLLANLEVEPVKESLAMVREHPNQEILAVMPKVYAGICSSIFSLVLLCSVIMGSDAAPQLLTPGRIESKLSLPLSRASILIGTYIGVLGLAIVTGISLAALSTLSLWWKLDIFTGITFIGAGAAVWAYAPICAVMFLAATLVRSASFGWGVVMLFWVLVQMADTREHLISLLGDSWLGKILNSILILTPPLGRLAQAGGALFITQENQGPIINSAGHAFLWTVLVLMLAVLVVRNKDY